MRRRRALQVRLHRRRARVGFPLLDISGDAAGVRAAPAGRGYASLGLIFEEGKDLPVGMSKRRYQGHRPHLPELRGVPHEHGARHAAVEAARYLGMPANTFDIMGFQNFFFDCAKDPIQRGIRGPRSATPAEGESQAPSGGRRRPGSHRSLRGLSGRDRHHARAAADAARPLRLGRQAASWGPGRVDTFNAAKVLFNFPLTSCPSRRERALRFSLDLAPGPREGMQLHWDGNNTMVEERNKSAAFGTGTTPPTIDLKRSDAWRMAARPRSRPVSLSDRQAKAARGADALRGVLRRLPRGRPAATSPASTWAR